MTLTERQMGVCRKFGANFQPCDDTLRIEISRDFDLRNLPTNGMKSAVRWLV
jgi:hypothetical protein